MGRLLEWIIKTGIYAGRGLVKSVVSDDIIIWYYMKIPKKIGLIWTKADGDTYLNDNYLGKFPIRGPFNKLTHRVILQYFQSKLGIEFDEERLLEHPMNARGRIIKDYIYVYDEETSKSVNAAITAIRNYIPEDWWLSDQSQ